LRHSVSIGGRARRICGVLLCASRRWCLFSNWTYFGLGVAHCTSPHCRPYWGFIGKSGSAWGIERPMLRRLPCFILGNVVAWCWGGSCLLCCCAWVPWSTCQTFPLGSGRLGLWNGRGLGWRYGRSFGRWYLAALESPWFPSSKGRRRGCSRPVRVCLAGQGA
jgi:hypothetical protein